MSRTKKEIEKELDVYKTKLRAAEADKEVFKTALRANGFQVYEGSSKVNKNKCDCHPIHMYKVGKKFSDFYPKEGCYNCPKCGAAQFCDKCIENYDLKTGHKRKAHNKQ